MCDNGHIISPKICSLTRHTSAQKSLWKKKLVLLLKIIKKDRFCWPSVLLQRKKRQIIYCVSASAFSVPSRKSDGIRSGFQKMVTQYSKKNCTTKKCARFSFKIKKIIVLVWMFIVNKAYVESFLHQLQFENYTQNWKLHPKHQKIAPDNTPIMDNPQKISNKKPRKSVLITPKINT